MVDFMVPRDGVEPRPPAFAGPGLAEAVLLILCALPVLSAIKITRFLE